jgi:hypothetical protein
MHEGLSILYIFQLAECHYADCYAKCHYAECQKLTIMPSVIILSVITSVMPNVISLMLTIMPSVFMLNAMRLSVMMLSAIMLISKNAECCCARCHYTKWFKVSFC